MEGEKRTTTADELLSILAPQNPGKKFAKSKEEDAIGVWSEEADRFVTKVCKTIMPGHPWVMMDYEIKINGEVPTVKWIPYEPAPSLEVAAA